MIENTRLKYETIEQKVRRFLIIAESVLLTISMLFFIIFLDVEHVKTKKIFLKLSSYSFILFIVIVLIFLFYILEQNEFRKIGIKQAIFNLKVRYDLENALLDSKIFFERMNLKTSQNTILVSLPELKINMKEDDITAQIFVRNSIKFQDKLERIDLSSAISDYVQESSYLLDSRDWYVFNLDLENSKVGFEFESIHEFLKQLNKTKENNFFIDTKFSEIAYFHLLLSGQTGSGKTYALYSLILQLNAREVQTTIIDPKASNLAVFGEFLGVRTETETQNILMCLRQEVKEMNQRKKDVRYSVKESLNIDSTALDFDYKPKYIIIDEFAALQLRLDRKQSNELNELIGQILLEGRSLGFYLILAMQQANAQLISTNLREQFQVQIVMGNSGLQTYNTIFGAHLASLIPNREMKPGEGWLMISGITVNPRFVRFPYLNFNIAKELNKI